MRFDLDDDVLLKVSSVGMALHSASSLLAPKDRHELLVRAGEPYSELGSRWHGLAAGASAAQGWVVSMSDDRTNRKDVLKVHGAAWLAATAYNAYNLSEEKIKAEPAYVSMAVGAILGGLCLWKGFENNGGSKLD